jgi:hypothetical protein
MSSLLIEHSLSLDDLNRVFCCADAGAGDQHRGRAGGFIRRY